MISFEGPLCIKDGNQQYRPPSPTVLKSADLFVMEMHSCLCSTATFPGSGGP